jgi:hypothetical protein
MSRVPSAEQHRVRIADASNEEDLSIDLGAVGSNSKGGNHKERSLYSPKSSLSEMPIKERLQE